MVNKYHQKKEKKKKEKRKKASIRRTPKMSTFFRGRKSKRVKKVQDRY